MRQLTFIDQLIQGADHSLRTITNAHPHQARLSPASEHQEPEGLTDAERRHAAGLMRINHTGEVCAQALYHGQRSTAKLENVRDAMLHAAEEEIDHLFWCEERIKELDSHTSHLNPLFYGMSYAIGAGVGLFGDRWSLGFVSETERQVCEHIKDHLEKLPENDQKSRAVLKQMHIEEAHHADTAEDAGAHQLPKSARLMMRGLAQIMKAACYKI